MIILTFIHMGFNSKKENGYNKMRPAPKYMDLQPSQTWLRKWRLLNGYTICLNNKEAQQHNIWQNHIPKFVHEMHNYRNSGHYKFSWKTYLKDPPISPKMFLIFDISPHVTQLGEFCTKTTSSIFPSRLHLIRNIMEKLLLETSRYRIPVVLQWHEDACSNSHINCNFGSKLLNSSKLGDHKVYSK